MRTFVINDDRLISPFNEPARDLMVVGPDNEPATLRIHQKELTSLCVGPCPIEQDLSDVFELESVLASDSRSDVRPDDSVFVYRDNIYFDEAFLQYFLKAARHLKQPCQAVLPADDPAWHKYSFAPK